MTVRFLLVMGVALMVSETRAEAEDGVKITGELAPKAHALVRLKVSGTSAAAVHVWMVSPSDGVDFADTTDDVCQFAAVPGQYRVTVISIESSMPKPKVQTATVTVVVPGCQPPTPSPAPSEPKGKGTLSPIKAVQQIQFGSSGCSATPIGPQLPDGRWDILTASHCIASVGSRGTMFTSDGRKLAVVCTAIDRKSDVAWLRTEEPTDQMTYAELATKIPEKGADVWHNGFGVDRPHNVESGKFVSGPEADGKLRYMLSVSSGDSGGAIFDRKNNRVLGPVCCTSERGGYADVWAGGFDSAAKIRPKSKTVTDLIWSPSLIPVRGEEHETGDGDSKWQPRVIPVRASK